MDNLQHIIDLTIEIEGLLRVLAREGHDRQDTTRLLEDKYRKFTAAFDELLDKNQEPEDLVDAFGNEPESPETSTDGQTSAQDTSALETVKLQEAEDSEVEPEMQAATEAIEKGEEIHTITSPTDEDSAAAPNAETDGASTLKTVTSINDVFATRPGELRLDEMLSQREARNLRKAFTLNDKFRFRRELFGNDDRKFAQTLDTIQGMSTFAEAEDYIKENTDWDMTDTNVADFMSIIQNHFNN